MCCAAYLSRTFKYNPHSPSKTLTANLLGNNQRACCLGQVIGLLPFINKCLTVFLTYFVLQKPERDEWGSGVEALECALQLEKSVNQSLLDLHKLCSDHNDPHVSVKTWCECQIAKQHKPLLPVSR